MKKFLISLVLLVATTFVGMGQLLYQSFNAPDATVTVVQGGIMVQLDGSTSSIMLYPQGFLSCYMYYASNDVNALFTADLSSMLLYVGGQTYQYTLTVTPASGVPGFNYPPVPSPGYVPPADNGVSEADRAYYCSQIKELRYKIRDAERSLRRYERSDRENPSISSMQLVQSQRRLISTYRERLQWLESQLY